MMKKLLSFVLLGFAYISLQAQCVPGPETSPGIYPDTITNLPTAYVSQSYFGVISAVIPADTTVIITIDIDSIGITGITGLPSGFIYTPNTVSGYWPGGSSGCIAITGTPTLSQVGIYPLVISAVAWLGGTSNPYNIMGYKINIVDTTSSVTEISGGKFELLQNMPNPFDYSTEIRFKSPVAANYDFSVCNILGEVVYKSNVNATAGTNTISFYGKELKAGLYMYKLSNGAQTLTKRMTIE